MKIRWLLDNIEEVKNAVTQDNLMVGTVDTWLIYVSMEIYVLAKTFSAAFLGSFEDDDCLIFNKRSINELVYEF